MTRKKLLRIVKMTKKKLLRIVKTTKKKLLRIVKKRGKKLLFFHLKFFALECPVTTLRALPPPAYRNPHLKTKAQPKDHQTSIDCAFKISTAEVHIERQNKYRHNTTPYPQNHNYCFEKSPPKNTPKNTRHKHPRKSILSAFPRTEHPTRPTPQSPAEHKCDPACAVNPANTQNKKRTPTKKSKCVKNYTVNHRISAANAAYRHNTRA